MRQDAQYADKMDNTQHQALMDAILEPETALNQIGSSEERLVNIFVMMQQNIQPLMDDTFKGFMQAYQALPSRKWVNAEGETEKQPIHITDALQIFINGGEQGAALLQRLKAVAPKDRATYVTLLLHPTTQARAQELLLKRRFFGPASLGMRAIVPQKYLNELAKMLEDASAIDTPNTNTQAKVEVAPQAHFSDEDKQAMEQYLQSLDKNFAVVDVIPTQESQATKMRPNLARKSLNDLSTMPNISHSHKQAQKISTVFDPQQRALTAQRGAEQSYATPQALTSARAEVADKVAFPGARQLEKSETQKLDEDMAHLGQLGTHKLYRGLKTQDIKSYQGKPLIQPNSTHLVPEDAMLADYQFPNETYTTPDINVTKKYGGESLLTIFAQKSLPMHAATGESQSLRHLISPSQHFKPLIAGLNQKDAHKGRLEVLLEEVLHDEKGQVQNISAGRLGYFEALTD